MPPASRFPLPRLLRILADAGRSCSWLWLATLLASAAISAAAEKAAPVTPIADIRALPREQAAEGRPVTVRGVVTTINQWGDAFVIQDETDGIYVAPNRSPAFHGPPIEWVGLKKPEIGMLVEVRGWTMPGGYAPSIGLQRVENLGTAPLPAARPTTLTRLLAGPFNCQRVELQGVVRRMYLESGKNRRLRLEVSVREGSFSAWIADPRGQEGAPLVDADVRLSGVCMALFNARGELTGIRLQCRDANDVQVTRPAPPDPFAVAEAAALSLRPFRLGLENLHRQRLAGVVTLARPGGFLYVQGRERAFRVNIRSEEKFTPGDAVEVSGFVSRPQHFAAMDEALVRKTGRSPLPAPLPVTKALILQSQSYLPWTLRIEDYDGARVALRGRLLKIETLAEGGPRLYLDCDGSIITADLGPTPSMDALAQLQPGSEVEATGICVVRLKTAWPAFVQPSPESFSLILQDASSIRVLRAPSWWTRERIGKVAWITLAALAAMLGWAWSLRWQVRTKATALTHEIRRRGDAAVAFQATLRERNRLALNLHDTLLQTIDGIGYQLDACAMSTDRQRASFGPALEVARRMVEHASAEVRGSVWALRSLPLHGHSFPEALQALPEQVDPNRQSDIVVRAEGSLEDVPDFVAGNALLILQEAMHNALGHGHARHIVVTARAASPGAPIQLTVEDDGIGFTPGTQEGPNQGHFGLVGMQERAQRLGGTLRVESVPGRGTTVRGELLQSAFDTHLDPPPGALADAPVATPPQMPET